MYLQIAFYRYPMPIFDYYYIYNIKTLLRIHKKVNCEYELFVNINTIIKFSWQLFKNIYISIIYTECLQSFKLLFLFSFLFWFFWFFLFTHFQEASYRVAPPNCLNQRCGSIDIIPIIYFILYFSLFFHIFIDNNLPLTL